MQLDALRLWLGRLWNTVQVYDHPRAIAVFCIVVRAFGQVRIGLSLSAVASEWLALAVAVYFSALHVSYPSHNLCRWSHFFSMDGAAQVMAFSLAVGILR